MSIIKRIPDCDILPAFYGIAWHEWEVQRRVCLPVPLNIVAAIVRSTWIFLRHGGKVVPVSPRAAYAQGIRDGRKEREKT